MIFGVRSLTSYPSAGLPLSRAPLDAIALGGCVLLKVLLIRQARERIAHPVLIIARTMR